VLNSLHEFLHIKRHAERFNENVYYLNQKGRELIGSEKERKYSLEVEHFLLRNDLYIHFGCPKDFEIERDIAFASGLKQKIIRPDARFTRDGIHYLAEIDRTQNMVENKKKIAQYAELSPLIKEQFHHPPKLIFYTITPTRKQSLAALCEEKKIQFQVITKQDIS
jgi:hypothetical protein